MKQIKRIGLMQPDSKQVPFLEFSKDGLWRIWTSYKQRDDILVGTFVELYPDGAAMQVTTDDVGTPCKVAMLSGNALAHFEMVTNLLRRNIKAAT